MNREREIASNIKIAFRGREVISREELNLYFTNLNSDITPTAARNRIYHLVRYGVISAITNDLYTFNVKPTWKPETNNEIHSVWEKLPNEYKRNELCLWTTKWLNEFVNLQAFQEVIFIEAEAIIASSIYHAFSDQLNHVYFQPTEKELDFYISTKELSYIVRPLITRAPIVNPNRFVISGKKGKVDYVDKRGVQYENPPRPRLEKLLTDLYYDNKLLLAWKYEEGDIWQHAYNKYNINFSTVYNYAKRRDSSVKIFEFISQTLNNLSNDITRFIQERTHP